MVNYNLFINSLSNNTIITLTNVNGKVVYWSSSGKVGFKGTKKSTSYSAQLAAKQVKTYIKVNNIKSINLFVKGFGYGRDISIKTFLSNSFNIYNISDLSNISFNGCRSKKKRRV